MKRIEKIENYSVRVMGLRRTFGNCLNDVGSFGSKYDYAELCNFGQVP